AVITGSTRKNRVNPDVAKWVLEAMRTRGGANFDLLDIKDFKLPLLGESEDVSPVHAWQAALEQYDGFIFVVAEYNHGLTGALKNALDSANTAWHNKAAGIVSYGSAYGARAAEQLRLVLGELQVADVRTQVLLSLFMDFENFTTFKPQNIHDANLDTMHKQLLAWSGALKPLRD
ncbi:MAG: NADPH-dependent oxidoreductase, partial [Acholeplasmatales bacterium]